MNNVYFENIDQVGKLYLEYVFMNLNTSLFYSYAQIKIKIYISVCAQKFATNKSGLLQNVIWIY